MTEAPTDPTIIHIVGSNQKEIIRIAHDGRLYWHGREVETDADFRGALLDLCRTLFKQPEGVRMNKQMEELVASAKEHTTQPREPVLKSALTPPIMMPVGPPAPPFDPVTGRVSSNYWVKGYMGAQQGAVYAQWAQAWMIYSMMGAQLDEWVMAMPPPGQPALASPTCIDDNVRLATEMNPPWNARPE